MKDGKISEEGGRRNTNNINTVEDPNLAMDNRNELRTRLDKPDQFEEGNSQNQDGEGNYIHGVDARQTSAVSGKNNKDKLKQIAQTRLYKSVASPRGSTRSSKSLYNRYFDAKERQITPTLPKRAQPTRAKGENNEARQPDPPVGEEPMSIPSEISLYDESANSSENEKADSQNEEEYNDLSGSHISFDEHSVISDPKSLADEDELHLSDGIGEYEEVAISASEASPAQQKPQEDSQRFVGYIIDDPISNGFHVLEQLRKNRSRKICDQCGQKGHFRRKCPNEATRCPFCLSGHSRPQCPQDGGCFICGSQDHLKLKCRFRYKNRCRRCAKAHSEPDCQFVITEPNLLAKENPSTQDVICLSCLQPGHINCSDNQNPEQKTNSGQLKDEVFGISFRRTLREGVDLKRFKELFAADFRTPQGLAEVLGVKRPLREDSEVRRDMEPRKRVKPNGKSSLAKAKVQRGIERNQSERIIDIFSKDADLIELEQDQEYHDYYQNQTGNHEKDFAAMSESSDQGVKQPNINKLLKKRSIEKMRRKRKGRGQPRAQFREPEGNGRRRGPQLFNKKKLPNRGKQFQSRRR